MMMLLPQRAILAVTVLCLATAASAQSPKFDTATVKTVEQSRPGGYMNNWPAGFSPGRVDIPGATLASIVAEAYGLSRYQFDENMPAMPGPQWIESGPYYAISATAPANASVNDLMLMLQHLLAERFKLAIHWEPQEMPAYALSAVNGGPPPSDASAGRGTFSMQQTMTMPEIVATLEDYLRSPVVDTTGLKGAYVWSLKPGDFCASAVPPLGHKATDAEASQAQLPACQAKASIFSLLKDKMNLSAEPREKLPVDTLVIDHVEKPSPN